MQVFSSSYGLSTHDWSTPLPDVDSASTLVLMFGAPEIREAPSILADIRRRYRKAVVMGCSTSGEINGNDVRDHSLSVAVARFEATRLEAATIEVADAAESFSAGLLAARKLERPDLRAIFLLSEGLHVNGSDLVRGLNSRLGKDIVATGGLAGDGTAFGKTWVYDGTRLRDRAVVAVGLYGDALNVTHGSQGGWQVKGKEHTVTLSKGNVLLELDGRPALTVYEEYLGAQSSELPASGLLFPLSMRNGNDDPKRLVRTLLAIDRDKKSLTFAGDIPMHSRVSVMEADFDRLVSGAREAGRITNARPIPNDVDSLTVAISCVGRRLVLKDRSRDEMTAVRGNLPVRSRVVGFYSYGEISPFGFGPCELHNQTMTLTMFSEDPQKVASGRRPTDVQASMSSMPYTGVDSMVRSDGTQVPARRPSPYPPRPQMASLPFAEPAAPVPAPLPPVAAPPRPQQVWALPIVSLGIMAVLLVVLTFALR